MQHTLPILIGKLVKRISGWRGGGSALPGLVIEKLDPHLLPKALEQLPHGVVVISGTNGKTTTTKMVVELLESQGLRVFTNRTGSNFVRGVIAALLPELSLTGKLSADIAVLELDEAHAVHFVRQVRPAHSLLLNVMRDQLDRFGEIDYTASLLQKIANATTKTLTVNREDSRVRAIGELAQSERAGLVAAFYGLSDETRALFPADDAMTHAAAVDSSNLPTAIVTLDSLDNATHTGTFSVAGHTVTTPLALRGIYNTFNAAAALALVVQICGDQLKVQPLIDTLAHIQPAFGRGESLTINGAPLELVLVKNPSGFRLGLSSFDAAGTSTMIAINDNYADGRDMSWLWDVPFDSLREHGVAMISGRRAYDMALRLDYDEVPFTAVEPDLAKALQTFLASSVGPKRIYCTYTAMLTLRKQLAQITNVETIS